MMKKLCCLLCCLALLAGLLPLSVRAADITEVQISGVDRPVAGKALDTTYTLPAGAHYQKDSSFDEIIWYDQGTKGFTAVTNYTEPAGTKLSSGASAAAGHYYAAVLHLQRTGSDMFPKKSFSVKVSDEMALRVQAKDGWSKDTAMTSYYGQVVLYYRTDALYDAFYNLSVTLDRAFDGTLTAGETPWPSAAFSLDYPDFTLTAEWSRGSTLLKTTDLFQAGSDYTVTLKLRAEDLSHLACLEDGAFLMLNNSYYSDVNVTNSYAGWATFTFPCVAAVTGADLQGIQIPEAGSMPQTEGVYTPTEGLSVTGTKWVRTSGVEFDQDVPGAFLANTDYRLDVTLSPAAGHNLSGLTRETVAAEAGEVTEVTQHADGTVTVGIAFSVGEKPKAQVGAVALTVKEPKPDELPIFLAQTEGAGYAVYADDGGSYIGGVAWRDETADPSLTDDARVLKNGGAFRAGHTYSVSVELAASEGYVFKNTNPGGYSDAVSATVNGEKAETWGAEEVTTVTFIFPALPEAAAPETLIDSLEITTPTPQAGEKPVYDADVLTEGATRPGVATEPYQNGVAWAELPNGVLDKDAKNVDPTVGFEAGKTYAVFVMAAAEEGYRLDEDLATDPSRITVNGKPAAQVVMMEGQLTAVSVFDPLEEPETLTDIDRVTVTLTAPVAGVYPTDAGVTGEHTTLLADELMPGRTVLWYEVTGPDPEHNKDDLTPFDPANAFEAGKRYAARTVVAADEGYRFSTAVLNEKDGVLVNGEHPMAVSGLGGSKMLDVAVLFDETPEPVLLEKVTVTVTPPKAGEKAVFSAQLGEGAALETGYSQGVFAKGVAWVELRGKEFSEENMVKALAEGEAFEANKIYAVGVVYRVTPGSYDIEKTAVYVNGEPVDYMEIINEDQGLILAAMMYETEGAKPVITRTEIPAEGTAYESVQTVELDGKKITLPAYALKNELGYDTNYIRIRDLADLLKDTDAKFDVTWAAATGIAFTSRHAYDHPNGTEGNIPFTGDQPYKALLDDTMVDGVWQPLTAFQITYNFAGHTYYQLRDLGKALGFNVGWSAERGIFLETDKPYNEAD